MAIQTLRFQFVGPQTSEIDDLISGSASQAAVPSACPLRDWTFDDASTDPEDVIAALQEMGWEQVSDTETPQVPTTFVFRPGGTAGGNVYTDWATLHAAYLQTDGPAVIQFDDSITSPVVIPAGTYAFRPDTTLSGVLRFSGGSGGVGVDVDLSDGVVFDPAPTYYDLGLRLRSLSSAPIISIAPTGGSVEFDVFLLQRGASFQADGAAPFLETTRLTTEGGVFIFLVIGGRLATGTSAAVNLLGDVGGGTPAVISFSLISSSTIDPDTLASNAQGSAFGEVDDDSSVSLTQSGYSFPFPLRESFSVRGQRFLPTTIQDATTIGALSIRPNITIRCDPLVSGPMAFTLPPVSSVDPGTEIIVKNVTASPSSITVSASGADTIDGAPSLVLSSPRGVVKLQADGTSDWMVVVS